MITRLFQITTPQHPRMSFLGRDLLYGVAITVILKASLMRGRAYKLGVSKGQGIQAQTR